MYFFKSEKRTTQNFIPNDFFLVEKLSIFWSQLWNTLKSKQKTFGKTGCFCNRNFDLNFGNNFVAICSCQLEKLIFLSKRDFVRILQEITVAIKHMAVKFFNSSGRNSDRKSSRLHLLLRLQNMKKTSQLWYWLTFGIGFSIMNYHLE